MKANLSKLNAVLRQHKATPAKVSFPGRDDPYSYSYHRLPGRAEYALYIYRDGSWAIRRDGHGLGFQPSTATGNGAGSLFKWLTRTAQ